MAEAIEPADDETLSLDEFLAGVFVPDGAPPPPHVQGPDWVRIPVTVVPRRPAAAPAATPTAEDSGRPPQGR